MHFTKQQKHLFGNNLIYSLKMIFAAIISIKGILYNLLIWWKSILFSKTNALFIVSFAINVDKTCVDHSGQWNDVR